MYQDDKGRIKLNLVGLVLVLSGLTFLIYSVICKDKVNIYNRSDNLIIVDRQKFLLLQFYFSILNSICMSIFGIIVIIYNLSDIYVIAYPLLFHIINYIIKLVAKSKQYIKYKQ